jgi:alpha-D-ribose 1-methylphosphonate 5-triphosphate synthase subunit PhnH
MVAAAFSDPVLAAQATFRAVLDATARPGTIVALKPALTIPSPLVAGAGAIALTLCDHDTPVWLDGPLAAAPAVGEWLRFHTAARLAADPANATFAFVADPRALPPFESFNPGTLEYPDRSTTIIVQVESFGVGTPLVLTGPGIAREHAIRVASLPADIVARLRENRRLFPRGVDLLLVAGTDIMALPRTTRVEAGGD